MTEVISQYWHQIVAAIVFTVWVIRLEARVFSNSRQTGNLSDQLEKTEHRLEVKIDAIENNRLAQRKEDLSNLHATLHEMKTDIKELLRANGKR